MATVDVSSASTAKPQAGDGIWRNVRPFEIRHVVAALLEGTFSCDRRRMGTS